MLWECFLESFVRDRVLGEEEHMTLKGNAVQPWTVQLLTIVGVAVGAIASFVSTRMIDRTR